MDRHVDGNALAGPLSEVFAFDATTAVVCCAACADVATLACAMVYGGEMGQVARCRTCDNVLLVLVHLPDRVSVALRGVSWLQVRR